MTVPHNSTRTLIAIVITAILMSPALAGHHGADKKHQTTASKSDTASSNEKAGYSTYGAEMPAGAQSVSLGRAIASLDATDEWQGTISGTVTEVCQKMGCWMALVDGEHYARVKFKDYSFFVPTDTSQQAATVHGQLRRVSVPAAEENHYEEDAGRKGTAVEPVEQYMITATSVILKDRTVGT
ncbi:MAG: DUF4920 domain-containing protein [Pseudomonadota bacterium]